ncbi:glycerol-3-phosphate dehydrogenase/oxidase [Marinobacter pelagius]|uniref:glycerol-3-phosphate dehydrogenase/oxidase n=1 Tax=Marinobacter sp. C7 TaxID=2951363 RepID=UPI001EF03BB1|nr:glycerol-3-phosphate dehydrogenase/oxidase [Marinobacter sp. C7]MCG7199733.1 glycerol-3-phosphate dehydrogenase/oxidase [Marinobacter sp. C7]
MARKARLTDLDSANPEFDVVVVGGGITGAGVAREAAGSGLRTLLVEQKDFAWGTSSRSSKMVHGGLRYLGNGNIRLTRESVTERQRLMREAPGLIEPLPFAMPHFRRSFPGPRLFQLLLGVYDCIAGVRTRRYLNRREALQWVPGLTPEGLNAASLFMDGVTDDARLVLRVLEEARRDGAVCLNYTVAKTVLRNEGRVSGVELIDTGDGHRVTVRTPLVINATGAWAATLQQQAPGSNPLCIRPLRGSHLVVPWSRLPVSCAVSLLHPDDGRPVFAFPWAGTTVLGTTDLDHHEDLDSEPAITPEEVQYLLTFAGRVFPSSRLDRNNILSTWAGVRPVVTDGSGKAASKESREHVLRADNGLVSIAGGKLTTFRRIAREALELGLGEGRRHLLRPDSRPVFTPASPTPRPVGVPHLTWRRLQGWYGPDVAGVVEEADLAPIAHTGVLWAELAWTCRHEQVRHLDDLLLRRTRLGLVLPEAASALLPELRRRCQPLLGWSDPQWEQEERRYLKLHQQAYSLPTGEA